MKIIIMGRPGSGRHALAAHIAEAHNFRVLRYHTNDPAGGPDGLDIDEPPGSDSGPDKLYLGALVSGKIWRWTSEQELLDAHIIVAMPKTKLASLIRFYQAHGHNVALIYASAAFNNRRDAVLKRAAETGVDQDTALNRFLAIDQQEDAMYSVYEDRIKTVRAQQESDALLYPNATPQQVSVFGEDWFLNWENNFAQNALDWPSAMLDRLDADFKSVGGPRIINLDSDHTVLQPFNWAPKEWALSCELFELNPDLTESIKLPLHHVEVVIKHPADPAAVTEG